MLREVMAAETLATALLKQSEFHAAIAKTRDAEHRERRATELARPYARGAGRRVVAELLLRGAETPDARHVALLIGARAYFIEDTSGRWVVHGADGEDVFFEDGEDEARELAAETGAEVSFRPGSHDRRRHYMLGMAYMEPIAVAAHMVAARGVGDCLGWHGQDLERWPCLSRAVAGYRPYCALHGGWDFRRRRGAWEVEREERVRRLFVLAAPAVLEGVRAGLSRPRG